MIKNNDLVNLKFDADDLDIYKFKTVPGDLSNVSNIVKNDVVKKTVYDALAKTVNAIQATGTCDLVKKTDYTTKIVDDEKREDFEKINVKKKLDDHITAYTKLIKDLKRKLN